MANYTNNLPIFVADVIFWDVIVTVMSIADDTGSNSSTYEENFICPGSNNYSTASIGIVRVAVTSFCPACVNNHSDKGTS